MPQLQKVTRSTSNGCLIHNNGKALFIKQPNVMELNLLYQAVMANIKMVDAIFLEHSISKI